jgi:hypothetical protein
MSKSSSQTKNYGLRLVLPGAAEGVPYTLAGLPGLYRTDEVTPVGGGGEPTLAEAREAAKGPDAPVKLEEVGPRRVNRLREEQPETIDKVAEVGQEG